MKVDYPSLVNKEKTHEKKSNKSGKSRRAYIAWEDNDTSSNNSSHEDVEANLCLMAGQNFKVCLASKKQLWYLDSGCSKHMTGDASKLINLKWKPNGFMTYGDNNQGRILCVGDIGGDDYVIIKDVLLVDGLKHSLLTISQLYDKGYKIAFEPDLCLITYLKTSEIVLVDKRIKKVYMVNVSCITSSMSCLLSRNDETWLWHRHLAHIHMYHLNRLASKELVIGLPKLKFERDRLCKAWQKGKQTKSSFKQLYVVSTSRPLELLHIDLFGPSRTMSIGGNYYGLVVIDDYSHFTWTLFIATKDEVYHAFKRLAKVIQNERNCGISAIK